MKFVFVSNYLNNHQLPFCLEMRKRLGADFCFVATTAFNQERQTVGYTDMNDIYDFVLRTYEDDTQCKKAMEWCIHADVMLFGSCPEKFFYNRILKNPKGITLRYSERLYKETAGKLPWKNVFFYWSWLVNILTARPNLFLLAASGYAPYDYVRTGFSKKRILKWGYFPKTSEVPIENLMAEKSKTPLRLIWVGRLLEWKRPGDAVAMANRLRQQDVQFTLTIIGEGPLRTYVEEEIKRMDLGKWVHCTGGLPNEAVRREMERSHIHLFTSDYNEGWGAVLNESMASACVPICSVAVGAAPFLIQHGENGFVYECGNIEQLCSLCKRLAEDVELLQKLQRNAYQQIHQRWNAVAAAESLLQFCEDILDNRYDREIQDGPCAKAVYVEQAEMYEAITRRAETWH